MLRFTPTLVVEELFANSMLSIKVWVLQQETLYLAIMRNAMEQLKMPCANIISVFQLSVDQSIASLLHALNLALKLQEDSEDLREKFRLRTDDSIQISINLI